MQPQSARAVTAQRTPVAPRARMRPRARKAVLVLHIASAGSWIGVDVMLGVLVFTALLTSDPSAAALSLQVLPMLLWPILGSALTCLATGVVLGLGSHFGLVRYWWVATKLGLNLLLTLLVVVLLRPGLSEAADYGRRLAMGPASGDVSSMAFPPIVSMTCLLVATLLSVYKPWGRVRMRAA